MSLWNRINCYRSIMANFRYKRPGVRINTRTDECLSGSECSLPNRISRLPHSPENLVASGG